MEVFQLMRSAGVRPNLHTYTTVMNLYANVRAPAPPFAVRVWTSCRELRAERGE